VSEPPESRVADRGGRLSEDRAQIHAATAKLLKRIDEKKRLYSKNSDE
jgi:hypothetical protein